MNAAIRSCTAMAAFLLLLPAAALADCMTIADPIDVDRPDSPDDSPTVPPGSLQFENGIGLSRSNGATSFDLPETRLRYGLRSCTELLLDLPDYTHVIGHGGTRGATDLAPGIKYQFDDLPEPFQLWAGFGVALPTGDPALSGRGPMPYAQIPASVELAEGLTLAAQYLVTFHPGDVETSPEHQASLDLEAEISDDFGVFAEYTGTYRHGQSPSNTADLGGTYRLTPSRAVDFLIGMGLNRAAPDWYFTVGYSLRFDQLF